MDLNKVIEFVSRMKFSEEIIEMNNDILRLKKYLQTLWIIKDKFRKGALSEGVNIILEPFNKKYSTSFKCEKDEDFPIVLKKMIDHITVIGNQKINKKIEEEISKKLPDLLNK